jgi:hypothetical protein
MVTLGGHRGTRERRTPFGNLVTAIPFEMRVSPMRWGRPDVTRRPLHVGHFSAGLVMGGRGSHEHHKGGHVAPIIGPPA